MSFSSFQSRLLLFLFLGGMATAQQKPTSQSTLPAPRTARLRVATRVSPDSVVLRWAPTTSGAWIVGNAIGYDIRRVTLDKNGKPVPGSVKSLTPAPLKPWSLEVWKQRASRTDEYAAIAAQALHGENFASQGNGINSGKDMQAGAAELSNRYTFSLVAADNDAVAAEGLALRYTDLDVKTGFTYVYRLRLARRDSTYRVDTAFAVASPAPFHRSPAILELAAESQERAVQLHWKKLPPGQSYS